MGEEEDGHVGDKENTPEPDDVPPAAPTTKSKHGMESISWNVDIRADGTLVDQRTGLDVTYLYWEA